MIKLIEFILSGCWHKWVLIERDWLSVIYKCTKCDAHKKVDL